MICILGGKMKRRFYVFCLFFLLILTTLSWASGKQEKSGSLTVVTTTSIITDVVQNIAGDKIRITGLIAKGRNPHNYEPTPKDMAVVEKADLIFVNGMDLEEALLEAIKNITKSQIVEVSSTVDPLGHDEAEHHGEEEHHEEEHHHEIDPHTWMSPLNVIAWADVISKSLSEIDPKNAGYYKANAEAYKSQLVKIDTEARSLFSSIPAEKRVLVCDHEILGYFSRDYGFEDRGALIPGFSTNAEISAGDLSELIQEVNKHTIPALFVGNTAGESIQKLAKIMQAEVDHPMEILPILTGSLSEDSPGDTYLSFIQYNIHQIARGITP